MCVSGDLEAPLQPQAIRSYSLYTLPASFESLVLHSPGCMGVEVAVKAEEGGGGP